MYFVTFWCEKCQTGSVVTVQSQSLCGTIKIKFLVFCLRAIKTCFFYMHRGYWNITLYLFMTVQLLRLVDLMCFCSKRADDVEKDC
jgi:hypothetical protein